ncbi:bifunctional (p)ppGpp synthetase/guanosine-3',5'-bis(diphosphate) 3'-pyrophosphohydrolase [Candidatus Microgenomates bacterium]|nr:bifunctional (p)ppGpp synthetase/guanosine-3',5'-bis(diphosphate) 3'-pyrophosphohydrolase [Candidatus Microgenomates bacterium]
MKNMLEELLNASVKKISPEEKMIVEKAFFFAEKAHAGQKRLSGEPYFTHCLATAKSLAKMGLDTETIAAGLLHDVPEDTPHSLEEIKKEFGANIAFLVSGVTKLGQLKYRGQERETESLRKMFLAMAEDIRVVLIKLADRLHNMQTLQFLPEAKRERIARETLEIYAPIADRLEMGEFKGELEDLAFQYLHPEEYRKLLADSAPFYKNLTEYLEEIKPEILAKLKEDDLAPISMGSRTKHLWSLYKKMQKEGGLDKVYDIAALRLIFHEVDECYQALGIIHTMFRPLPGKIKDYIAVPKPNGYQSIHTTVITPEERIIEIQIRTRKMHEEAEHGIAAHWAYVAQGKPDTGGLLNQNKFSWVKQLKEWQKNSGGEDFIESLRIDFFKNRIFVFTPRGDVIDMPEGATPVDFAYAIHSDIGNHCAGAKVSGKMVGLDYQLKNGEVVEIITQKNKKPSNGWLDFVKTSEARTKIKSSMRQR